MFDLDNVRYCIICGEVSEPYLYCLWCDYENGVRNPDIEVEDE